MSARADSDVDWQLVRRRRRELGISQHQLAQVIGAYAGQISRLEDGLTTGSRAMTVAKLCQLADALSVEPGDLLHRSDSAPSPPGDADNARRLGAVLVTQHRALRPLALAAAMRLNLDELHRAAELLETRLRPFGITVARENLWRLVDDPLALTARDRAEVRGAERAALRPRESRRARAVRDHHRRPHVRAQSERCTPHTHHADQPGARRRP